MAVEPLGESKADLDIARELSGYFEDKQDLLFKDQNPREMSLN